jgi:hypothetical protein
MRRPSPALIVAFLALSVALGGVAWAGQQLPRDSVGPAQIRDGAVRTQQVRDRSLLREDFRPGQLPRGARGARGSRGPRGRAGAPGATRVTARRESGREIAPGAIGSASVTCPGSERATGGGGGFAGPPTTNDRLVESIPVGDGPSTRWRVTLFNGGTAPRTPVAYAVCAAP